MSEKSGGGPGNPRAIVVGHGEFAGGLVLAVGQICGMADRLVVLTMMGMTPEDIEATIRDQLARDLLYLGVANLLVIGIEARAALTLKVRRNEVERAIVDSSSESHRSLA